MEQYINRLPLAEVTANTKNPRTISEARLQKLIDSLLVFPQDALIAIALSVEE